jgi:hypothetical protein
MLFLFYNNTSANVERFINSEMHKMTIHTFQIPTLHSSKNNAGSLIHEHARDRTVNQDPEFATQVEELEGIDLPPEIFLDFGFEE